LSIDRGLARRQCGGLARRFYGGVAGLSAVILVRHFSCPPSLWRSGGLEGLSAVFLAGWPEFLGEEVIVAKIKI